MDSSKVDAAHEVAARVESIRRRLPGQTVDARLEMAQLHYGPLYSLTEVRERVAESLPPRLGYTRGAVLDPIESYTGPIPNEALLKYDDAWQTGLFSQFWVATPRYFLRRQADPWIIGEVAGTGRYGVIARWD